jgi:hypothetical protein
MDSNPPWEPEQEPALAAAAQLLYLQVGTYLAWLTQYNGLHAQKWVERTALIIMQTIGSTGAATTALLLGSGGWGSR